jgi:2'-5' RNA ligase
LKMSMRCFIAIEAPEDIQDSLGRIQDKLRGGAGSDVKWTEPRNIHLTVKFLGDVNEPDLPKVCDAMSACALAAAPIELDVSGLGTFPESGPPRVVWAGVTGDVERLAKLVESVEQAIADAVGIAPERRPYHAHLTLGRCRSTRATERLTQAIDANRAASPGAFTADRLVLFMSELQRGGAVHTPMATAPLGKSDK